MQRAPIRDLNKEDWRAVFHHLNAHYIERREGSNFGQEIRFLGENSPRFFLYQVAEA